MTRKPQKETIHEYLAANPASTVREVAESTGIKLTSVGAVIKFMRDGGLLQVASETSGANGMTYRYEITPGTEVARSMVDVVYDVLLDSGEATVRAVAEQTGISVRQAISAITTLRKAGKVEAVGVSPDGHGRAYMYRAIREGQAGSHEEVIQRSIALGGGPFGLMAAQLGAEI